MFLTGFEALDVLLPLALILLLSKLLQMGCKKIKLPQVVGMLLAGILVGLVNYLPESNGLREAVLSESAKEGIKTLAKIGVVLIMFGAGLDTNLKAIKQSGVASIVVTLLGVAVPLAMGFAVAGLFNGFTGTTEIISGVVVDKVWSNLFYGVIITATSVSVTVAALKEMGRLNGKAGTIVLSAAILDDIIGVVVLSIILSLAGGSAEGTKTLGSVIVSNAVGSVVLDVVFFFIFTLAICIAAHHLFKYLNKKMPHTRRIPIFGLVLAFFMSWASEKWFGVADITGAFFAGLALAGIGHHINPQRDALSDDTTDYVERKNDVLSYMIFSPIFFADVGLGTDFSSIKLSMLGFGVAYICVGLLSKVIGCGTGAKLTKSSWKDSLRIGVGMMARAEVCLICAQKGIDAGLVDPAMSAFIVIMIVVSSFITPLILKATYKNEAPVKLDYSEESFTGTHEESVPTSTSAPFSDNIEP